MSQSPLGRTLIIANPAAHSGKGAAGAEFARHFLTSYSAATDGYELKLTTAMGDARVMAAEAADFDTVVALGGDGVIHEVVNGLMTYRQRCVQRLALSLWARETITHAPWA